jgi:uncharacterized phiE125 gp8 family phage protein
MLRVQRQTSLSFEPVTLAEAKNHLRVDIADDDDLINRLVKTARLWCEEHADITLVGGAFFGFADELPLGSDYLQIPGPPLTGVTGVVYVNQSGGSTTIGPSGLLVDTVSRPGRVFPSFGTQWPTARQQPNAVRVEYTAGPLSAAGVDERAKQAMLMLVGHWYENREAVLTGTISKDIEFAVAALLSQLDTGLYH